MTAAASDLAYEGIRDMLIRGQLLPGQRLSQSRLARQLGCSPMPVVEAMRRLESEGLLDKQPRKQARVRQLSREDLEGLFLLREAIEGLTARLCAQRITPEGSRVLEELARSFEEHCDAKRYEAAAELDVSIHRHIAKCARNSLLLEELSRFLLIECTIARSAACDATEPGDPLVHRAVVQAIVDHDADSAEYLMKKHIHTGCQIVLRALTESQSKVRQLDKHRP